MPVACFAMCLVVEALCYQWREPWPGWPTTKFNNITNDNDNNIISCSRPSKHSFAHSHTHTPSIQTLLRSLTHPHPVDHPFVYVESKTILAQSFLGGHHLCLQVDKTRSRSYIDEQLGPCTRTTTTTTIHSITDGTISSHGSGTLIDSHGTVSRAEAAPPRAVDPNPPEPTDPKKKTTKK